MSIFSTIFGAARPNTTALAAPVAAPQPGNLPVDAAVRAASTETAATAANGVVPATADVTGAAVKTGLDQFADLFQTDPNAQAPGQPLFNIKHEDIMASARKQDFRASVTPEQMAAINAGGPEAFTVMAELMNTVGQNVFAQNTQATTKLIEAGLKAGNYARTSDVDAQIRSSSVSNSLRDTNPLFSHPAVAPMLAMTQAALLQKHPNATPQELTTMAQDYVLSFAAAANKPAEQEAATKANKKASKGEVDWSIFA